MNEALAWTSREPERDGGLIRQLICFFDERVDFEVDAECSAVWLGRGF